MCILSMQVRTTIQRVIRKKLRQLVLFHELLQDLDSFSSPWWFPLISLCNTGGNFLSAITEADSRKEFFLWSEFTVITSTMSWDAASFFSNAKLLSSAKSKCGPLISSKTGCIAVLDLERQMFALVFLVWKCLLSEPRQEFSAWKTET